MPDKFAFTEQEITDATCALRRSADGDRRRAEELAAIAGAGHAELAEIFRRQAEREEALAQKLEDFWSSAS